MKESFDFSDFLLKSKYLFHIFDVVNGIEGVYLSGGAIRSLFDETDISDYDFFFSGKDSLDKTLNCFIKNNYAIKYVCKDGKLYTLEKGSYKVQLVCEKFYNDISSLIDEFDFINCSIAFDIYNKKLVYHDDFFDCVNKKILKINKITYPFSTFFRIMKYIKKGYKIEDVEFQKFCKMASDININDKNLWRIYID